MGTERETEMYVYQYKKKKTNLPSNYFKRGDVARASF
jgi:hypothetical protein